VGHFFVERSVFKAPHSCKLKKSEKCHALSEHCQQIVIVIGSRKFKFRLSGKIVCDNIAHFKLMFMFCVIFLQKIFPLNRNLNFRLPITITSVHCVNVVWGQSMKTYFISFPFLPASFLFGAKFEESRNSSRDYYTW